MSVTGALYVNHTRLHAGDVLIVTHGAAYSLCPVLENTLILCDRNEI